MDTDGKKMKKPTKIEEMTKEQIRQAIIKKRECNAKAQTVVTNLLENCVNEEYFFKCLPDINQSHFEDVLEERSISRLCGYPLCHNQLQEKDIPKQKYRISMKTNKVYDITVRKFFCSNICYKSAMHVKKQMLTSPLWFREYEEIPKFYLLPLDSIGCLGQEIDLGLTEKITLKSEKLSFTSINAFSNASLHDINECQNTKNDGTGIQQSVLELTNHSELTKLYNIPSRNNSCPEHEDKQNKTMNKIVEKNTIVCEKTKISNIKKQVQVKSNLLNIVGEIIEKPERKIDPILLNTPSNVKSEKVNITKKNTVNFKKQASTAIIIEVEKCLAEWFTIDTLLFLFGEQKVKEMVTDKGQCIKEYLQNYQSSFNKSNTYDQYQALCRKLNMLELEDKKYDTQSLMREMKPLPDYSVLKEESNKIQLKVTAFLAGETAVPEVETIESEPKESDENVTKLLLVNKNSQNALRRQIVCQHLNKVLPDLLKSLRLLTLTMSAEIRLLVNTFTLKANNIMFKPIQWSLIAIVFIKLLSIRDKRLEHLLEQPMAFQHMQLLLLSYKQDGGYLERLISWLTDIDRLIDYNNTQLTID